MQYAFVLCRLFHEASFSQEETSLISKVDFEEADCISSSEDTMLDKLAGNESEGINHWLIDKFDNMASNDLMFTKIYKTF